MCCSWLEGEKRALSDLLPLITWSKHLLKYSHRSLIGSLLPGLLSGLLTGRGQGESQHLLDCISRGTACTSAGGSGIRQHSALTYTPVPRSLLYSYKLCTHPKPCNELWICLWRKHSGRDFNPEESLMSLSTIQEMETRAQISPLAWLLSCLISSLDLWQGQPSLLSLLQPWKWGRNRLDSPITRPKEDCGEGSGLYEQPQPIHRPNRSGTQGTNTQALSPFLSDLLFMHTDHKQEEAKV